MAKNIELELRSFVSDKKYLELLDYYKNSSKLLKASRQITYYLDTQIDTRIQISSNGGKVWQKLGNLHDESREEIEIVMDNKEALRLLKIFNNIGYDVQVAWYRSRKLFEHKDFDVALDDTVGYGKIFEVERRVDSKELEKYRKKLRSYIDNLGLEITPRSVFEKQYRSYLKNWKSLTKGLDEKWIQK